MEQYRCNGLDIVEDDNLIWIKIVRDGSIVFSARDGETCFDFDVKLLNRYNNLYHNEPRNDFVEMLTYSLISHGVKKNSASFIWGLVW